MRQSRNCFANLEDAGIPLDGDGMVGKEAGKAFQPLVAVIGLHRA